MLLYIYTPVIFALIIGPITAQRIGHRAGTKFSQLSWNDQQKQAAISRRWINRMLVGVGLAVLLFIGFVMVSSLGIPR